MRYQVLFDDNDYRNVDETIQADWERLTNDLEQSAEQDRSDNNTPEFEEADQRTIDFLRSLD